MHPGVHKELYAQTQSPFCKLQQHLHLLFEPADRGTTMTVSVTQEQMQQNIFHHTLTAYIVGYAQEKGLWIENMADESVK